MAERNKNTFLELKNNEMKKREEEEIALALTTNSTRLTTSTKATENSGFCTFM